ncbi:LCP family protein [Microlunatus sp. Gsoil 973]|jgi:LCP family protein required for cell wall assembly|uniref:LCP family protein n=1 Tax=Microlunatus sp. Gsoil 973 TaxID=2672569 RepID=UPI0012B4C4EA|nr:LCP family protein [Microlunatus sp. Gsoil 973]QGN35034.1 LytR family transcriptional regulator [Microlunatus sp. Gsoil 973]
MASERDLQHRPRNRPRIGRRALLAGGLVLVPVAAFGGYEAWSVTNGLGQLHRSLDLPGSKPNTGQNGGQATVDPDKGRPVNIMLLGSDSRDQNSGDGRSDTIMLLHLAANREDAYLISFPRDMWVEVPGRGKNKINAAYSYGGTKLLAATVNKLTGITVDHAAVVDFAGFADLTDSVGGVTITNNQAFSSHGYDYPKGRITLSGKKALWFVRERHALPDGDFGRAANQRKVVKALAAKLAKPQTLADPTKLSRVVSNLAKYVTVDKGLNDRTILGLARSMKVAASALVTLQAPVSGTAMIDGQSVDIVDAKLMRKLAEALRNDTVGQYAAAHKSDG